ncbi:aspartate aminotransferase family protein [Pseudogemmobacter hezensis]|uniref:aspartate aminotransferase family protein n=1 Tax=Pseudogemmobacter hezensis TaxID=2737662 RepID=UPI001C12E163|nr:aspartate aminotransferase family protein [Pseudogemmobacter hezensis]
MSTADTAMANAWIRGAAPLPAETEHMIGKREGLLGPAYRLMYQEPLHFVKGEGAWLIAADGRRYLDAYNNVTSLGHCHPRVVEAIATQAATLATNTRYIQDGILRLAEKLLATMPSELGHMMLTCTGSEANDLATRIACAYTGGTGIIVTETAYHGITGTVAQYSPSLGPSVDLGPHVALVPAPGDPGAEGPEGFGNAVRAAIARLRRHGIRPAMLIVDTMFTSDGVRAGPAGFLAPAVQAIHEAGGIFVADEVQPGFARTGECFWGFQRHGVVPDIVSMGKPMGNGHPVAGIAIRPEVVADFGRNARYFNTFGGNSVSCAAALAVLNVIADENLQDNAQKMGARMMVRLQDLSARYPLLADLRGAGLMIGAGICRDGQPDRAATARIVNDMRQAGVLISSCGRDHNVLKIRPPLIVTEAEIDLFADTLGTVLEGIAQ